MGIFSSLFGEKSGAAPNPIRDTLFGDLSLDQWPPDDSTSQDFPWSSFITARSHLAAGDREAAVSSWRQVLDRPGLESRHYLQAWHFLRQNGQKPPSGASKQVLGVIIEVSMQDGLDIVAAYLDHSARYYNYSGAGVVWEHPDNSLDSSIDDLLEAAAQVVLRIGPWEKERPSAPPREHVRLSFLTPSGLHFGQGPMTALSRDPLGGRVLEIGSELMKALISKTKSERPET